MSEHIFISHSAVDNEPTEQLANALNMANFPVWVDFRNIRSGDVWVREIETYLQSCAVFLLVWSASARRSKWVNKEILTAIELEKPIIIARLDDEPLSLAIIDIQAVSLTGDIKRGIKRLVDGLKGDKPQVVEAEPTPSPDNFFRYLKNLPDGKQNTLIARDLFHWANDQADEVSFGGKITPAFQARVAVDGSQVTVFAVRAYPKRPAIQIQFMYLMNYEPYQSERLRRSTLKSLNRLMNDDDQFVVDQADRAPTIPLAYFDRADKIELFKQIMAEIFDNLRGV